MRRPPRGPQAGGSTEDTMSWGSTSPCCGAFRRLARLRFAFACGVAVLAAVLVGGSVSRPAAAAPGESMVPIADPDLAAACGIDIEVILDRSGSIASAGATNDVKRAFRAFTDALNNTGSRLAVADFSTSARLPLPAPATQAYTTVTDASIANVFDPYINSFNPSGSTNWE